jgi:23S rRNA pseudouridine2605 synthase
VRLNKYLSECGVASRRNSEQYILEGRISVNGNVVIDLGTQIDPAKDVVSFDGSKISQEKKVYFLINKPKGVVTTTKDEKNRANVTDLVKTNMKIFPVGRLDYNTTGTLILTNDGEFSNFLLHPKNKFPRVYEVGLDKPLAVEDRLKLLNGIYLDKRKSVFTEIKYPKKNDYKRIFVTTVEGRNHFVKRMFSTLNYTVKKLHRYSFADVTVNNIEPGNYRKMLDNEIQALCNYHKNIKTKPKLRREVEQ